jgi:tripartite-type tricarboxylate transporter receptor subunit TctC
MPQSRRAFKLLGLAVLALSIAPAVAANPTGLERYPVKPIVLVVAGAASGGTDSLARILAHDLSQSLGQSVIVENRAGAGGLIGAKHVANAAPDGYTFLLGHMALNAIVPALVKPPPFTPLTAFVPVSMVGSSADVLVVRSETGIRTVQDLLSSGSQSAPLTYGSPGVGQAQHIAGFALAKASGVNMQHVPYKGSAPALQDLIGGRISTMFVTPGAIVPYLKSQQLSPLAVTSPSRSRFLPDVPTIAEVGFPAVQRSGWFGVFAPAKTPTAIVELLSQKLGEALANPATRSKIEQLYIEPAQDASQRTFAKVFQHDVSMWADRITQLGVTAE